MGIPDHLTCLLRNLYAGSVQSLSCFWFFATPRGSPGLPVNHQLQIYPYACPLCQWCHPTILSSVVPFSFYLQSFPASRSFPMSRPFAWGGQSIGVSAPTSVLPMNTQDWSPLGWTGWISLLSKVSQESCPTSQFKSINSLAFSFLYSPTLPSIHEYWKNHNLD